MTDDDDLGYRVPVSLPVDAIGYRSECSNCTTTKIKWMARRGYETTTRYYHPDGYSRTGEEALTNEEWRQQWLVSLLGDLGKPNGRVNGQSKVTRIRRRAAAS